MATYNDFNWKYALVFLIVFLTIPTMHLWAGLFGIFG
ncbi:hypothetical protein MOVI109754_10390 [Moritella viscosa]|nr:hypothetical protein PE36_20989 [Moritella sp. PE36]